MILLIICLNTFKCSEILLFDISNTIYQVCLSISNNVHTAVLFQMTNINNP